MSESWSKIDILLTAQIYAQIQLWLLIRDSLHVKLLRQQPKVDFHFQQRQKLTDAASRPE